MPDKKPEPVEKPMNERFIVKPEHARGITVTKAPKLVFPERPKQR